eukprot:TRINITY_DN16156_c0_g2_i1.p1 TRINITY_DN16156_c0_g2~~TRINITY_DN16156_c0_g2_i1.p1  ORF type:complete len:145 (+),score=10.12 TRINITY_DN16156_c0_g2_i1:238-672(+)
MGQLHVTSILGGLALIGALVHTTVTSIQHQVGHIPLHDSEAELRDVTVIIPRLVEGSQPCLSQPPMDRFLHALITPISPSFIPNSISAKSGPSLPIFDVACQDFPSFGPRTSAKLRPCLHHEGEGRGNMETGLTALHILPVQAS